MGERTPSPSESTIQPEEWGPTKWELENLPSHRGETRRPAYDDDWPEAPDDPDASDRLAEARAAVEQAHAARAAARAGDQVPVAEQATIVSGPDRAASDLGSVHKAQRRGPVRAVGELIRNVFRKDSDRKQIPPKAPHQPAIPEVAPFDEEGAAQTIMATAQKHEIVLEPERLKKLVEVARDKATNKSEFSGREQAFDNDGVLIQQADGGSARIDFLPPSAVDGVVAKTPQREDMTRLMLMGIRSLQDYILLVEAGYIARPPKFDGKTNPTMATIAGRFGFVAGEPVPSEGSPGSEEIPVNANFADVRERVLSPEIRRYEALLAKRAADLQDRHTGA